MFFITLRKTKTLNPEKCNKQPSRDATKNHYQIIFKQVIGSDKTKIHGIGENTTVSGNGKWQHFSLTVKRSKFVE
ncbi:MAG: hypothetical protein C0397_06165 [Odoribacter sp.]|nr:hypothetical protein [Odoribacter sp.]